MTNPSHLSVDHSAVSSHVQSLQHHHQTLQEQSQRFLDVIEPLKGVWKGTSVVPWDDMTANWHESMTNVNTALDQLTGRVDSAGQIYRTGEEEQTSTLQNRLAGMDMPTGQL